MGFFAVFEIGQAHLNGGGAIIQTPGIPSRARNSSKLRSGVLDLIQKGVIE